MAVTLSLLEIQEEVTFDKTLTAPVVSAIERKLGRPVLIKLVCAVLKLFADGLNVTQTLTALQVYELAQLWIEQYPTDSLKDLILCLKRVKQGKYGKIYNRIDIEVISEFWTAYLNDKAKYRESQHLNRKTKEASGELEILSQITSHAPETAKAIRQMVRKTPELNPPIQTSHERYIEALRKKLPSAYMSELEALRKEAVSGGKNFVDVLELVDKELAKRAIEEVEFQKQTA